MRFLTNWQTQTGALQPPVEGMRNDLYMVTATPCSATNSPFPADIFSPTRHVTPTTLWSQTHTHSISDLCAAMLIGTQIEQHSIDAVVIPVPDPEKSLDWNMSNYAAGSLPLRKISTPPMDTVAYYRAARRPNHGHTNGTNGCILRTMQCAYFGRFGNDHVRADITRIPGLTTTGPFSTTDLAWNTALWTPPDAPRIPDHHLHLWSSYRLDQSPTPEHKDIQMFFTLRALDGLNSPLSRSTHPSLLLPQ